MLGVKAPKKCQHADVIEEYVASWAKNDDKKRCRKTPRILNVIKFNNMNRFADAKNESKTSSKNVLEV